MSCASTTSEPTRVTNLVYIDILPFVGDQGVLDTELRDRWTPSLISAVGYRPQHGSGRPERDGLLLDGF